MGSITREKILRADNQRDNRGTKLKCKKMMKEECGQIILEGVDKYEEFTFGERCADKN